MAAPLLSIVVPMYNVEKYIRRCLDSCLDQKGVESGDYEVIVVNDGSPDSSLEIAETYQPRVRIISQENQGLSAARNAGTISSSGRYVAYVDSDDWISDNFVSQIKELSKHSADVICIGAEKSGKVYQSPGTFASARDLFLKGKWRDCAPLYVCRRDFLMENDLHFMKGVFHEDSEYTPRLLYKAASCAFSSEILYHIFESPGSITRTPNVKRSYDRLTIAESLLAYEKADVDMPQSCRNIFREHAVIMVNCALRDLRDISPDNRSIFEKELERRVDLIGNFGNCGIFRYKIEKLLFTLSGKRYFLVFRLLDKLK